MRTPRSTRLGKALSFWGGGVPSSTNSIIPGRHGVISQGSDQTHTNVSLYREPTPFDLHLLGLVSVLGQAEAAPDGLDLVPESPCISGACFMFL